MSKEPESVSRVSTLSLAKMKREGRKITVLTAYDYPTAKYLDEAGIDVVLVGDSLGMVVLGYDSTLPVTLDVMLHHTSAVSRGVRRAMVVGDMPFLSFNLGASEAVRNAGKFLQEAGAQAVKLEGGVEVCDAVRAIVSSGIPVMGHIGLTPQSIHQLGGFRTQGQSLNAAEKLMKDAVALEQAGAFSIVLEKIPWQLAKKITEIITIPTIGIGAGPHCDGQVLVTNDMVGMFDKFVPKFVKRYAEVGTLLKSAFSSYIDEVRRGEFPRPEHSYDMDPSVAGSLDQVLPGSGGEE